jgi:hypothetical protein
LETIDLGADDDAGFNFGHVSLSITSPRACGVARRWASLDASASGDRPTVQFGEVEHYRRQASMNVSSAKPRSERTEKRSGFGSRFPRSTDRRRRQPLLGASADSEIGPDQQVQRRMLGPIGRQFFDLH